MKEARKKEEWMDRREGGRKDNKQTDTQTDRGIKVEKGRGTKKQGEREREREERTKEQSKNGKGTIYLHLVPIFPKLIQRNIMYIMKCLSLAKIKTTILNIRAQKSAVWLSRTSRFPH